MTKRSFDNSQPIYHNPGSKVPIVTAKYSRKFNALWDVLNEALPDCPSPVTFRAAELILREYPTLQLRRPA